MLEAGARLSTAGRATSGIHNLPLLISRVLRKLGQDIDDTRRWRRTPAALLAERASISRKTLVKAEKGSPVYR